MTSEVLYFGTGKPKGGAVTAQEWRAFLDSAVTPRFPSGFSVLSATGQWRSGSGAVLAESSYVLNLVYPDGAGRVENRSLGEIIEAYKTRFGQESVLRVSYQVCAGF